MATLRSTDWVAEAMVFSGRPDPSWTVSADIAFELVHGWEQLTPRVAPVAEPPPLGYRGCRLLAPDGRQWRAFDGVVTMEHGPQGSREMRDDPTRSFERTLLATAPPGLLPPLSFG